MMYRRHLAVLAAIATTAGLVVSPATAAPEPSPKKDTFARTRHAGRVAAREALKETKGTSMSVALLSEGKVVWSQGFGRVSLAGKKPSPRTKYGIGSVSKMVTALAVMQLVDDGKVSLDAPVVRYLPEFTMQSPQYRQITVRMLLNHSAGFPGSDYVNGLSYTPIPGYPQQVLKALSKARLKATPGAVNVYCNDCFTLAGEVVSRVSGTPFEEYVKSHIFGPLGMTHSGFSGNVPGPIAAVIVDGTKQPIEYTNIAASGGVVCTTRDMLKLAEVFTGDRPDVLSNSALAQMGTDQTTTTLKAGPASEFRYGLGWDDVRDPGLQDVGVTAWVKGGDVVQHHAGFIVAADQDMAVVVLAAGAVSSTVAETVGRQVLFNALVDTGAVARVPQPVSRFPAKAKASVKQVRRMEGTYLGSMGSVRLTATKSRSLRLSNYSPGAWTKDDGTYVRRADGRFWSTAEPGTSFSVQKAWGRRYLIRRRLSGTKTYFSSMAVAQKVRSDVTLPAWRERNGQRWLMANENPSSTAWRLPFLQFDAIPGITGYMMADGALVGSGPFQASENPDLGSMFLQIPLMGGRDLYDFEVATHGGEAVLQFGSAVFRQLATVPPLTGPVTIGSRGYAEWFTVPTSRTVTLSGQSAWKVFDEDLSPVESGASAAATVSLRPGSYLALFGPANGVISVG